MENWEKPSRDHRKQNHRENPSFSSSLLDVIYRSIDEGETQVKEVPMRKQKQNTCFREEEVEAEKATSTRRARKVENWMMEKKRVNERVMMGRNSLTEFERRSNSNAALSMHSSSTSSDSSGFSSSESESFFYGVQKPKPIRTSVSSCTVSSQKTNFDDGYRNHQNHSSSQTQKPKHDENGFGKKTKSKALRILYGELKKAKQPISPGARLASFLNSLFTSSGNAKKATKVSTNSVKSAQPSSSTCSSASSFSRSCLSKTPSSRTGGAKRSVRFCPVSVILDEDCRPCGHKNLHHEGGEEGLVATTSMKKSYSGKSSSEEVRFHVMEESRRVEELAKELLKNYQKKKGEDFDMYDEDDDDGASCSSSDLFELDNLSAIGIERYREELPVYETTHYNTNRAIANGFIL